jgi:surface protein
MGKNKLNKPTPKTQREISVDLNKESYGGLTNPNLPSPKDPEIKRASKTSFKGDDVKPFSIGIKDIDEAVFYYFENVIKPFVIQNGERLTVPVIYGSPEKWKSFQKDGYYRDQKGKIMAPLIMFKKESMDKNRAISNKLDANQPNNYSISTKKYNARNSYDNFSILTNRIPEKQYYATVIPDYVTITYTCVIFTYYVEQLNKIVESIEYASDAYWGDPQRFKFKASIDSFGFQTELVQENERIVRSTFDIKLNGYITPEILQKDLESIKKFTNTTRVNFEIEDQLVPLSTLPLSPSIKCADAFYVLQLQDGTVVEQGSIPSGESKIIIVPESGDATYTLTDSDGNILETGNIPAGSGAIIIAPDGLIQNSDVSYTASVLSDGLLTLPDVDILVVDENDNPLQTSTIPSIKNHTINVFCSPALVENSDTSYTSSVAAGGTLTLPDQDIEVNGVLEGDIPSVGTIEIEVNDEDGNPLAPDNVTITGRKVEIDVNTLDYDKTAFVMLVNTGILGETADNQFKLNFTGTYDVKTSDGQNLTNQTDVVTLTFPSVGNYLIEVKGNISVNYAATGTPTATLDRNKVLQVVNWGTFTITSPRFAGLNTQVVAKDAPILGGALNISFAARIPIGEAINTWNLSPITAINGMFFNNTAFNQPLNSWNTTSITSATALNAGLFQGATSFNQPLSNWNTANFTTFVNMFTSATRFNQNLGAWNVSGANSFVSMFESATAFNNGGSSDINNWVFSTTQNISFVGMFRSATAFNQPLNDWNTGNVTNMSTMFIFATAFNQPLNDWNTGNVTNMQTMFGSATAFNQDISSWNVSNVTTFGGGEFSGMFRNATAFNQNLGAWQLRTAGTNLIGIFSNSGMNTANYTDTIVGWANYVFANSGTPANVSMTFQAGRTFTNSRSGGANFVDAQAARAYLVSVGWTISGDTVV